MIRPGNVEALHDTRNLHKASADCGRHTCHSKDTIYASAKMAGIDTCCRHSDAGKGLVTAVTAVKAMKMRKHVKI